MKKILWVACLALAAATSTVHAAYLGANLSRQAPFTFEMQITAPSTVTLLIFVRGRFDVDQVIVFDPQNPNLPTRVSYTIPPRVERIVFEADVPVGTSGMLKIEQGTNRFEIPINQEGRAVFDVVN